MPIDTTTQTTVAASATGTGTGSGDKAAAGGEQTASTSDYLARIASDPDFAQSEVRKHQSRADQAEAQVRAAEAWKALAKWHTDPAVIDQHLQKYVELVKQQDTQATSKEPNVTRADDDEFLTDDEKKIRELESKLSTLEQQLGQATTSIGQQSLTTTFEKVATKLGFEGDEYDEALGKVLETVKTLPGNHPVIQQLQSPSTAASTVEALIRTAVPFETFEKVIRKRVLRDEGLRQQLRTDGPSGRLPATQDAHKNIGTAYEALMAARRNPALMDNTRA